MSFSDTLILQRLYFPSAQLNYSFYNVAFQRIHSPTPGGGVLVCGDTNYKINIYLDTCSFQDCSTCSSSVLQMVNISSLKIKYCSFDKMTNNTDHITMIISLDHCYDTSEINQTYYSNSYSYSQISSKYSNKLHTIDNNQTKNQFQTIFSIISCDTEGRYIIVNDCKLVHIISVTSSSVTLHRSQIVSKNNPTIIAIRSNFTISDCYINDYSYKVSEIIIVSDSFNSWLVMILKINRFY